MDSEDRTAAALGHEDTAADRGNDLMALMTLREELEECAIKAFDVNVTERLLHTVPS